MTLKEEHNKVARTAAMIIGEGGQEVLKHANDKDLREVEDKLATWLRISEKASDTEIKAKIKLFRESVGLPVERKEEKQSRITLEEIRKWIESVSGQFNIKDLYAWMPELSNKPPERRQISNCLGRLVKEGVLERDGRYGVYRKVESELERMDFLHADTTPVDIWLPFNLTDMVEIMPGNIIAIAGEKETGKTTLALNIAWTNRNKWDVHYFNSEMGNSELKKRISKFEDTDLYEWAEKISFYPKSDNFQDVIQTGSDKLNIIDFMEVAGDDYPYVASWILQIHKKIIENGAIVIICLEKPKKRDTGVGGRGTLDKPRLYLAMTRGKIKIVTAKNWATDDNPRDQVCEFKVVQGAKLIQSVDWNKVDKWCL